MADNVGRLTVLLGLDAAEYTRGLTKAEREAQQFARALQQGIREAAGAAGVAIGTIAAAAVTAAAAIDQLVKGAAEFKDLEERTGASAESIASFAVSAKVAGVEVTAVADAMNKLAKNLTGVDDESKAAGAALEAIGLSVKEFKALSPDQQILALAKAFGEFADGSGKAAAQMALLGKSGAQLNSFFKELQTTGGQQVILTQKQIELADEYADAQTRLTATIQQYAQAAATQFLPAINSLLGALKEFAGEIIGVDKVTKELKNSDAIAEFANNSVRALAFIADSVDSVTRIFRITGTVIGATAAQIDALASGSLTRYNAIQKEAAADIDAIIAKQTIRFRLERNIAEQASNASRRSVEDRGFVPRLPQVRFSGGSGAGKAAKEEKDAVEQLIASMTKQLQASLELDEVETARVAIYDLLAKGVKNLDAATQAYIVDIAEQLKFTREDKKAKEEAKRAAEEEARARERVADAVGRHIESARSELEAMKASNEGLREQIIGIRDGEDALLKYQQAKILATAAELEQKAALEAVTPELAEHAKLLREQAAALRERASLLGQADVARKLAEETKAVQQLKGEIFDIAGRAVEDLIVNGAKASDVLKQLEKDLLRFITQASLNTLKGAFTGAGNAGGLWETLFKNFNFGGLFGGGAVPGSAGAGMGPFAWGGVSRGGLSLVGEQGPELVTLPAGARVTPNNQLRGGAGLSIVQNINVMPGANTQSARQAAARLRDATMSAVRDR